MPDNSLASSSVVRSQPIQHLAGNEKRRSQACCSHRSEHSNKHLTLVCATGGDMAIGREMELAVKARTCIIYFEKGKDEEKRNPEEGLPE